MQSTWKSTARICSAHFNSCSYRTTSLFTSKFIPSNVPSVVKYNSCLVQSNRVCDKFLPLLSVPNSITIPNRNLSLIRKSSFLSDKEGVNTFIDLLGEKEKNLLMEQLMERMKLESTLPRARDGTVDDEAFHEFKQPTRDQLKLLFAHQLLPFVGFGFLDNLIMILAGEYIDTTIGVTLGISTMAAAGLGNALSDVAGIGSAWYVEQIATRLGIKYPNLSSAQESMKVTKVVTQFGRVVGVFLGCLLGMFPLLFYPSRKDHDSKISEAKVSNPASRQ